MNKTINFWWQPKEESAINEVLMEEFEGQLTNSALEQIQNRINDGRESGTLFESINDGDNESDDIEFYGEWSINDAVTEDNCTTHEYWANYFTKREKGTYCPDCGCKLERNE